ncbi:MAG: ankyrin repeat domain-containing protein [archaeon]|nr:ankyrin repeat domain-containing protein [archaeon]
MNNPEINDILETKNEVKENSSDPIGPLQQLFHLLNSGNFEEFKNILQSNKFKNESKNGLLRRAFKLYNTEHNQSIVDKIKILLENGAVPYYNSNKKDKRYSKRPNNNLSPLCSAIHNEDITMINLFINTNSLKDYVNQEKILFAVNYPNSKDYNSQFKIRDIIKKLQPEIGINFNEVDEESGDTPLILAIKNNLLDLAKFYVENGSNINYINPKDGNSIMHYAVMRENSHFVEYLLNQGEICLSVRNRRNETVLDIAAKGTQTDLYAKLSQSFSQQVEKSRDDLHEYVFNDCILKHSIRFFSRIECDIDFKNDSNENEIEAMNYNYFKNNNNPMDLGLNSIDEEERRVGYDTNLDVLNFQRHIQEEHKNPRIPLASKISKINYLIFNRI